MKNMGIPGFAACFTVGSIFFATSIIANNVESFKDENPFFLLLFFLVGLALVIISFIALYYVIKTKATQSQLKKTGTPIIANVLDVELCTNVIVMNKSPYRIKYGYHYNNSYFEAYGDMVWNPPAYAIGDNIEILVDDNGNSAIK